MKRLLTLDDSVVSGENPEQLLDHGTCAGQVYRNQDIKDNG